MADLYIFNLPPGCFHLLSMSGVESSRFSGFAITSDKYSDVRDLIKNTGHDLFSALMVPIPSGMTSCITVASFSRKCNAARLFFVTWIVGHPGPHSMQ